MNINEKYAILLEEIFKQYVLDFSEELYEQALESTYKDLLEQHN